MSSSLSRLGAPRSATARHLYLAAALALSCAHVPPAKPEPLPPRPEHRSSVAAVLAHRGELGLTDAQAQELSAIDERLQQTNASLRAEVQQALPGLGSGGLASGQAAGPGTGRDTAGEPLPGSFSLGGEAGAGRQRPPGAARGGGRGTGGMEHRRDPSDSRRAGGMRSGVQEKMDENDAKAYFEAESLLTDAQRLRAREIAEQYREQLFEWREAARGQGLARGEDSGARTRGRRPAGARPAEGMAPAFR